MIRATAGKCFHTARVFQHTAVALLLIMPLSGFGADFAQRRAAMVETITGLVQDTTASSGVRSLDSAVEEAFRTVPRHRFVPKGRHARAYANRPLPIGHGQTISQPYIVALMTQLLAPQPDDDMLEIGTGSGYQAAILAEIVNAVHSIEIIPELHRTAQRTLADNGYDNVITKNADGYQGWPEHAPFDGIVVTAAVDHVPPPLVKQLAPGGRLVLPLGDPFTSQVLTVVEKTEDGSVSSRQILPVRFVPLTRADSE